MSVHDSSTRKKVRVPDLVSMKGKQKISCVTCYDASFARLCEKSGVDLVLVGDSLGNVVQGLTNTIGVTIDQVVYHTQCVSRALSTPLLVADMPFCTAGLDTLTTCRAAESLLRAGAEAVKIEGATPEICQQIDLLVRHGIPVMGHVGLTPQSVHALGGFKIQGKTNTARERLLIETQTLQNAGCFAIVLELMDHETAAAITESLQIPTIGIGAGPECDGQILVLHDLLGMNLDFTPKFLRRFAQLEKTVVEALNDYTDAVRSTKYP